MSFSHELWDTFRKLAALEARTEDVSKSLERVEDKIDNLIDRLSRVEAQYQGLRESVRNEILADVKAEIAVLKFAFDGNLLGPRPELMPKPSLLSGEGES